MTSAAEAEGLVSEFAEPLLCAALGLGFARADAEELAQDVLVAFLGAADRFERRSSLKTYLFGILYNKARELRRKRARETALDEVEAAFDGRFGRLGVWNCIPRGPEDEALAREAAAILEECARGLSLEQRTAFYLKEAEGESTEAVCAALGVTANHVGVLLFRARNRLRDCVEKKWRGPR